MYKLIAQHYDREETGNQFPFNYLHGEIERINGYDIVTKETEHEIPFGIWDCIVDVNGKEYECKLFTWDSRSEKEKARQQEKINLALKQGWAEIPKEPRWTYQKGLIVLKGDKQAMKDAYSKYKRKECMI